MPWPPHPRGEAPTQNLGSTQHASEENNTAQHTGPQGPCRGPGQDVRSSQTGSRSQEAAGGLPGNCVLLQNVGPPLQPQCRHQPTALKHKLWLQAARSPQTGRFPPHCPGWRTAGSTQPHQLRYRHLRPCGHHLAHALCRMAEHRWSDLNWHFHKTQYSKVTQRQSKANPTVHGARCTMNSSSMVLSDSGSKAVLQ